MNKIPVIVEALCYLLSKLNHADKIQLVKLMYLADKYHLMNYGRTISDDVFIALEHGPAGSRTMDVIEYDEYVLGDYLSMAKGHFKKGEGYQYLVGDECDAESLEMLSESDIEALDFVINNFGSMNKWDVVNYTHTLQEWKQFEPLFETRKTTKESIKTEDLLLPVGDRYFTISEEHLEESRKILTGTFD